MSYSHIKSRTPTRFPPSSATALTCLDSLMSRCQDGKELTQLLSAAAVWTNGVRWGHSAFVANILHILESKKPAITLRAFLNRSLAMSYSHMGTPTLPSALLRFTSEFGMGSGGTTALLSLNKKGTILENRYKLLFKENLFQVTRVRDCYFSIVFVKLNLQNHLGVVWLSLTGN